ncbi:helix-turn-helix domain-containing protein [Baekduia sp.]|jgi:AcrR family transcriptional regulator|uniref:TetR/AcrR family transcriptional regulator n=1 Tax=Baekduia sp. TaxID=2600305 RepID=UPI002E07E869|nr:helix-turn-helix domain-containing protein [Baekduia sp.]
MKTERRPYRQTARAAAAAATRERILDVATAHFLERFYDDVTLVAIAKEAGVSQQTVINHFASKEGLLEVVAGRLDPEHARHADLADPVTNVVEDYEPFGDAVIRMLALEERVPALAPFLARGRTGHRAWVAGAFAGQLPDPADAAYDQALNLHVLATDIYTWKLLRRDMGLSLEQTIDHMRALIAALAAANS